MKGLHVSRELEDLSDDCGGGYCKTYWYGA